MPTLTQVPPSDPRLDRLMQLYMHEWSAVLPMPIGPDARYPFPALASYGDGDQRVGIGQRAESR